MARAADHITGVRRRMRSTRSVALTFDDGPDPEFTPQILDILAAAGIAATFFVVGDHVERYPELVQRIVREGHALGSHSQTHRDPASLSLAALSSDYRAGRRTAERVMGQPVRLFRPPLGRVGLHGALVIRTMNVAAWRWSIDPSDWQPSVDADQIVEAVENVQGGDVILLHDGIALPIHPAAADRGATVEALGQIIERVRARDLDLCALPSGG